MATHSPPKNVSVTSFPDARGKTGCAVYCHTTGFSPAAWVTLALARPQAAGSSSRELGTAVGISAKHQLCIPLPGCGSGVKGMAGPAWPRHSLSPPRAVGGLIHPPLPPPFAPQIKENK